ncbi:hypothetical protein [Vibrio campbellii]|uniref:hypothetical protein n=1 Tax=Vibrio campbellii TaxID=680 RepID=UPI0005ED61BE|nr:hypothetical protein [Vibrio campbellii]
MDINAFKDEVSKELKVDIEELDYITEEELKAFEDAIDEDEDGLDAEGASSLRSGVYCNSLVPDSGTGGYLRYKRGKKGTNNYGCGTERYKKKKDGTSYRQIGSCSGGRKKYLVEW